MKEVDEAMAVERSSALEDEIIAAVEDVGCFRLDFFI